MHLEADCHVHYKTQPTQNITDANWNVQVLIRPGLWEKFMGVTTIIVYLKPGPYWMKTSLMHLWNKLEWLRVETMGRIIGIFWSKLVKRSMTPSRRLVYLYGMTMCYLQRLFDSQFWIVQRDHDISPSEVLRRYYSGLQNPRHFRNSPLFRPCLYKQLVLVDWRRHRLIMSATEWCEKWQPH